MQHKGTQTIETNRLVLRGFRKSDGKAMFENWASDEEVTRFLTWPAHANVQMTEMLADLWETENQNLKKYQWCIVWKEKNEPIGSISVVHMNEGIEEVEIGYCIGRKYWNHGVVTEALEEVIRYFFEEVQANRVMARHDVNNPASGRVMKKCGMQLEGIRRQGDRNNQGICDTAFYSILKEEFYEL